jgi:catechol 2,3-dioxygenase-like lactoylglutathione lyase family enzyme
MEKLYDKISYVYVIKEIMILPKFDHVGIYVRDLQESVRFYQELFGFPVHGEMKDGDIDMIFLDMNGALLQLKQRPNPPNRRRGEILSLCYLS